MASLMERLDRARKHEGGYDEASYALAAVAADWLTERLADPVVRAALTNGTARGYYNADGSVTERTYPPGWEAVAAQALAP